MKAVLIVGLPGSGKTYTAVNEYVPQGFVLVDDPRTRAEFEFALLLGKDLVITHPHLTRPENRPEVEQSLLAAGFEIEWVFFENDPVKAQANVDRREITDPRPLPTNVASFSRFYTIPEGVEPRPIWTP